MAKSDKKKRKWQDACRNEMKKATLKEARHRTGKKNPPFNYRWEHVKAVVNQARKLAKLTGADRDIVIAAAWLHDVKKFEDGSRHGEKGAEFAREFLPKTDFPSKKIEAVAHAISVHVGLWRDKPLENLEAQVLWDADKLTKIGLTSIFHLVPNEILKANHVSTTASMIKFGKNATWLKKTVASFHTKPAQKAGASRLKAYTKLWRQLEEELRGNDL